MSRNPRSAHVRETWITMAVVFTLAYVADLLGGAAPALAVVVVPLMFYYLFRAPFWVAARLLIVLAFFVEPPAMVPGATYWISPLRPANELLYNSMKNSMGVPGASMSLFFVLTVIVLVRAYRKNKDPLRAMPSIRMLRSVCITYTAGLVAVEVWGIVNGGKIEPSFFQAIQLLTIPILTMALAYSLRGAEEARAIGNIIVHVAIARGILVAYTYFLVCLPAGIRQPEYCTTHGDSTTFATAILILAAQFALDRRKREIVPAILTGLFLTAAMVMNNRRLAFVCVGVGLLAMYITLPPSRTRQRLNRYLLIAAPILFFYMIAGEGTTHPVFAPARLAWSALEQKDLSADSRDVENLNLVVTLAAHPILGQGFGHEYMEVLKVYDISEFMPLYRYIPHNSIIWLWTMGGLIGFVWLWILPLAATYYGARAFRLLQDPGERTAALVTVGGVTVWTSACWGDVGMASETNVILLAVSFALAAKLNAEAEHRAATPVVG